MPTIIYRHATIEDSRAAFEVYQAALVDLGQRRGFTAITGGDDPSVMSGLWQRRRPLFEHLAQTAD